MAGDLEDFLRRAAQRRQAKAAQQKQQEPPARRPRPQYTDQRTERQTRPVEDVEEILTAELVEDDPDSVTARMRRIAETKRAAAQAEAEAAEQVRKAAARRAKSGGNVATPRPAGPTDATGGNTAEGLLNMLRQPEGIRRAILLREILDRPEHRW